MTLRHNFTRHFCPIVMTTLFGISTLTQGCETRKISVTELDSYIIDPKNGLTKTVLSNDIEASLSYQPTDLLIAREIGSEMPTKLLIDSLKRKYNSSQYFLLSLSKGGRELLNPKTQGQAAHSELLQKLAFGLIPQTSLFTAIGDTLKPTTYVLDRSYGMQSSTRLLFAFPRHQITEWMQFNLQEFGLKTGDLEFRYTQNNLNQIPRIDFNLQVPQEKTF